MDNQKYRPDDYLTRRESLKDLSDDELKTRFWELAEQIVDPLVALAYRHTTPAIERSILLRMGFSSIEAKIIVQKTIEHGLIGKGAGHVVYRYSQITKLPLRDAGLALMDNQGWEDVLKSFGGNHVKA